MMKKFGLAVLITLTLLGCGKVEEKVDKMITKEYEKMVDVADILDVLLTHIADKNRKLSFEDGELIDTELGIPKYEITSFEEIEHFNPEEIVDGYVVKPVVETDNPHLLIVIAANGKEDAGSVNKAMQKVLSDQTKAFHGKGLRAHHLVNTNQIVRQGNYLIYATWEGSEEISHLFERYVK